MQNLGTIINKINKINIFMQGLIQNEDNSYNCNINFMVVDELVYNGKLIINFNKIDGYFDCSCSKLNSLKGCPKEVNGYFSCSNNKLSSLKYCPEIVNGSFNCCNNKLTSLKYCPKEINNDFWCSGNSKKFTEEYIKKVCNVKDEIFN
jgi:hypothetical protein